MPRKDLLTVTMVGAVFLSTGVCAQGTDLAHRLEAQKTVLQQIEEDLARVQEEAERARAAERDIARRFVAATNRVSRIEYALAQLVRAESALVRDMAEASARRAQVQERIRLRQRLIARRVRILYMHGRRQPYQRALLASSLVHWLAARHYMATLNRRDMIDLIRLRQDRAQFDSLTAIYRQQREVLDTLIARKQRERAQLLRAQRDVRELLRRVRRNRRFAERAAAELEAQRRTSQEKIAQYLSEMARAGAHAEREPLVGGASATAPVDFAAEKGRLPWPVRGPIVGHFGRHRDRETRTWTRNRGIDIGVPKGTDVKAVASGHVVLVDWFRGYGTFVIVSHGQNYYTLYAHLGRVAVRRGDYVRQGQIIGVSGESEMPGEEKVHFELFAGHEAQNPLEWLAPNGRNPS